MKKLTAIFLAFCCLIFSLAACGETKKDTLTKIRVNEVTHSIFYAPLYIAIENGFFKNEGIEIELTNGGGADKSMTALLSGNADIGFMGVEAAIYVYNEGKNDYPKVFSQLTKRDGSFLVSRKPEPDFKWENLENKTVLAGRTGGVPAMTFEYVVNKHGLKNGENITLNNDIAFNLMGPSFEGGTGDYTTLFEPLASEYQKAGKGYVVASVGKESGEIPYTAFMASKSYIEKNAELLEKFLTAIQKAIKYLDETDKSTVAKSIAKQFPGTDVGSVTDSLESYISIDAWTKNTAMTEEAFNNLQSVMENAGELDKRADYNAIAYNDIAEKVYKKIYA